MKTIQNVLLVFDNAKELESAAIDLSRNGFETMKSGNLSDALNKVKNANPDLIVIKTSDAEKDIEQFRNHLKIGYFKKTLCPGVIRLDDYLHLQTTEHIIMRGLSNKNAANNKVVFYFSGKDFSYQANLRH